MYQQMVVHDRHIREFGLHMFLKRMHQTESSGIRHCQCMLLRIDTQMKTYTDEQFFPCLLRLLTLIRNTESEVGSWALCATELHRAYQSGDPVHRRLHDTFTGVQLLVAFTPAPTRCRAARSSVRTFRSASYRRC